MSRPPRGHRRAKTTVINLDNSLADLHIDEGDGKVEESPALKAFRRKSARVAHLRHVSLGGAQPSADVRTQIAHVAAISGNQFYDVIAKWDELPLMASGDVHIDMFIDAYKTILYVLDAFGAVFNIIKQDLKGQMAKTKEQCTRYGVDTLQHMAIIDGKNGKGTQSLLWLKRTLQFTEVMLAKMLEDTPLPEAVDYAYHRTLIYAHPFVVKAIAKNIRFATPDTNTFLTRIYKPDTNLVQLGIGEFLIAVRPKIAALVQFYNEKEFEQFQELRFMPIGF